MSKSLGSQPEAGRFRSILAVIIILGFIFLFLSYTESLSQKAEIIARDVVLTDISYSLSMMLYDFVVKGKQEDLKKFDNENPFIPLAIYRSLPTNYHGAVKSVSGDSKSGWYFEIDNQLTVYLSGNHSITRYQLKFQQSSDDKVGQLVLSKVEQ